MALNFIKRVLLGGFSTADSLEANFGDLETATADGLSRSGNQPNAMGSNLDMNSNLVLNLPQATATGHAVEFSQFAASSLDNEFTGYTVQDITATAAQTVFTLATEYTPGISALRVYINGVYQSPAGYTETSTTVVTFSDPLDVGDVVSFVHSAFTAASSLASSAVTYAPPGTGVVGTNVQAKLRETISVKDFGAVGDGVADDTAEIQAAIDSLTSGGTVWFPYGSYLISATLILDTRGIKLIGESSGAVSHDTGSQVYTTQLLWGGAVSDIMVHVRPDSGDAQTLAGMGVSGFRFDGGANGARGLVIESTRHSKFKDLHFESFSSNCLDLDVLTTLSEPRDTEFNVFERITFRQYGVDTGTCLAIQGDSTGNSSHNQFISLEVLHDDGHGIDIVNGDNNLFFGTRVDRDSGGTGTSTFFRAGATAAETARHNTFYGLSNNGPITAEGTPEDTVASLENSIFAHDAGNNSTVPTINTGATTHVKSTQFNQNTVTTFTSTDATPTVAMGRFFITAGTTNITDFDDGVVGQTIHILATANITIVDGAAVVLNPSTNFAMVNGDTLTLTMYNDQIWQEDSRSNPGATAVGESAVTFTGGDATPSVSGSGTFISNDTTSITDFDDGVVGQTIHILAASSFQIVKGSAINLQTQGGAHSNFQMVPGDSITFKMYNDQVWEEVSRTHVTSVSGIHNIESLSGATTITPEETGKTFFLSNATGFACTLPAPDFGLKYKFIVNIQPTSGNHTVVVAGSDRFHGQIGTAEVSGPNVATTAAATSINFIVSRAIIGDFCEVICDNTNWYVSGLCKVQDGMTTT